ncbi:hypothetical protein F5Y04DRAFT_275014 [Hypomontagnella monticulosa]|nr:hypothetical protein F5Y04DRAFT_275014 [Hypomontagnella monticulosa]
MGAASPTANQTLRRDPPITCGPEGNAEIYSSAIVLATYEALSQNQNKPRDQRPRAGTRAYPQQYGRPTPSDAEVVAALDAIPACRTGQEGMKYFEFPLTPTVFTGGDARSQGPDRVVSIGRSRGPGQEWDLTKCLAMTHRGGKDASDPRFFVCH